MKSFTPRHFSLTLCTIGLQIGASLFVPVQADTIAEPPSLTPTTETPAAVSLPVIEPRAFEILRRADAIYKKARSFSLQMQVRLVSPEHKQDDKFNFNIQAKPLPQRLRLIGNDDSGKIAVISDGQKVWRTHSMYENEYSLQPFRSVRRLLDTSSQFEDLLTDAGAKGYAMHLFFTDRMASILLAEELQSIRVGTTTTLDGVSVEPVIVTISNKDQNLSDALVITFFFGRDDHLLRRTLFIEPNQDGYVEETYSNIRLNLELPESLFTFKPAKNMKRVPSVDPMSREVRSFTAPIVISEPVKSPTKKPKVKPQTTKSRSN